MFFAIDPSNGVAIYEQIVRQIAYAVAREALPVGQFVPSVRELAKKLAVNPNTVSRAYRDLQTEGILAAVRGEGLEVAQGAVAQCRKLRKQIVRDRLADVLTEARRSGLDGEALRGLIDEELVRSEKRRPGE